MSRQTLIVGSRGSALALWQANHVIKRLQVTNPELDTQLKTIKTQGDLVRDRALSQVGGKGLFVKEIENALLAGEIDLAVHSLKDMPTEQPRGLALGAVLPRADARDALVTRRQQTDLAGLPEGAIVGTSSLRRKAQVLALRPDLQVHDLRGNVDTRLGKLRSGQYDAVVLAAAGLIRLGHADEIDQYLPPHLVLPAVGQGALCIEVRADDAATRNLLAPLDHAPTRLATTAERAFLHRLEGGCQVPIAAYGQVEGDQLHLWGLVAALDGSQLVKEEILGPVEEPVGLGAKLAEQLLAAGGGVVLEAIRREN
jgi:hydroxymethylbilane synthase